LLLGIEQLASDLAKSQAHSSLAALNPTRLKKAKEIYKLRKLPLHPNGDEYESKLLDCTAFVDKIIILEEVFNNVVPACLNSLSKKAESIRNSLAHPGDEGEVVKVIDRRVLLPFLMWAEEIQAQMRQALEALKDQTNA